jgi:BspA type Leucine rich repeat region (6 copies)
MKLLPILLSLLVVPAMVQAQTNFTAISNLNQPYAGYEGVSGNQALAMSFTTGNTLTTLSGVSVSIAGVNPSGSHGGQSSSLGAFAVAIYSDAEGSPGNNLEVLSGNNYPTNAGIYTYNDTSDLLLITNTTYWIVGTSSSTGSAGYKWTLTSSATVDPGSIWVLGLSDTDSNGRGWNNNSGIYPEISVAVTTNLPTTPIISIAPTASPITYGQTLASSTLSGGAATNAEGAPVAGSFAFTTPSTVPTLGTSNEPVTFTPTDTVDYSTATTTVPVTVTINQTTTAPLISSLPTASAVTYGQTLASSTLSGGAATNAEGAPVAGSFAFTTPLMAPGLGTSTEPVTFTPTDTADYTPTVIGVPVTVIPFAYMANTGGITNSGNIAIAITNYTGPGGAVTIPGTINGLPVTSIGSDAFLRCNTLTNITIPDSVTNIGEDAFAYCENLAGVTMGTNVINIGVGAFNVCESLTNVTIPDSVINIGEGAFAYTSLINVAIPDSVISIGENAFDDDSSLATVTIGCGVTNIGIQAFSGFNSLTSITVNPNNPAFSSLGGVLFNQSQTLLIDYPGGLAGSYTIPDSVNSIGYEAFGDCGGLTSVTIPNTVTSIGGYAFVYCSSLTSVVIPDGVTNLQEYTFADCTSLTSVTIGGSVGSIGSQASSAVKQTKGVAIPNALSNLESFVFQQCGDLTNIYFSGNAPTPANDTSVFSSDTNAIVYYLPGTTGWGPTFDGVPTVLWNPQAKNDANFGVQNNQFGFNITGSSNLVIVVDACTNLADPVWQPVETNILTGGSSYFSDPLWTNYPGRYYRIGTQ